MEARNMNEEKVEDMKALHDLRMTQVKPRLALAEPTAAKAEHKGVWARVQATFKAVWNLRARPDLDLESWREIEFRERRDERQTPSRFDRGLWL